MCKLKYKATWMLDYFCCDTIVCLEPLPFDLVKRESDCEHLKTKIVFNEWNARINEHAAIPVYGISSLKHWMMDNIKPEAVRKSTEKATAAANATFQLPDAQIKIMHITADSKDQVLRKYRDDIKKIADKAADDYIKKALEEHKAKK
ncbi:predicted protein [Nematostella vectensis]|uniref:Uncharacterized protein n=1 Tax=Nematostella vectensis TaxID=45351 RepID=A7S0Z5_NEMVE|nr:predicted protein [Nematostella vectensis]|eukprot:XP_001634690.1 predicted protein [Nematostella vectensis]